MSQSRQSPLPRPNSDEMEDLLDTIYNKFDPKPLKALNCHTIYTVPISLIYSRWSTVFP